MKEKLRISWFDSNEDYKKDIQTSVTIATKHGREVLQALDARVLYG